MRPPVRPPLRLAEVQHNIQILHDLINMNTPCLIPASLPEWMCRAMAQLSAPRVVIAPARAPEPGARGGTCSASPEQVAGAAQQRPCPEPGRAARRARRRSAAGRGLLGPSSIITGGTPAAARRRGRSHRRRRRRRPRPRVRLVECKITHLADARVRCWYNHGRS